MMSIDPSVRLFSRASFIVLGSCLLAGALPAAAQFSGSATNPDGSQTAADTFKYDTENGAPGTILSQDAAEAIGLGTINPDGTFSAPMGTADWSNAQGYDFWCFPNVTIDVRDSNNQLCSVKQTVYVAKNETPPNNAVAHSSLLNQGWINAVGGCIAGAGASAKAYWNPGWSPPSSSSSTNNFIDPATGVSHPAIGAVLESGAGVVELPMVFESLSDYTFVPQAVADALNLSPTGSIDLSSVDPELLDAMDLANMRGSGQTMFQTAFLPRLATGVGPDQSGEVLISDDANSGLGILGGSFVSDNHVYANGAGAGGNDLFGFGLTFPVIFVPLTSPLGLFTELLVLGVVAGVLARRRSARA